MAHAGRGHGKKLTAVCVAIETSYAAVTSWHACSRRRCRCRLQGCPSPVSLRHKDALALYVAAGRRSISAAHPPQPLQHPLGRRTACAASTLSYPAARPPHKPGWWLHVMKICIASRPAVHAPCMCSTLQCVRPCLATQEGCPPSRRHPVLGHGVNTPSSGATTCTALRQLPEVLHAPGSVSLDAGHAAQRAQRAHADTDAASGVQMVLSSCVQCCMIHENHLPILTFSPNQLLVPKTWPLRGCCCLLWLPMLPQGGVLCKAHALFDISQV